MIDFDDALSDQNDDLIDDVAEEELFSELPEPDEPIQPEEEAHVQDPDPDPSANIIGNPEGYLEHWHPQAYDDTCAVAVQEFILDELAGVEFSEDALRQEAIDNGWYVPGGGTPLECMGNLLEAHGMEVERHYGCTLADLGEKLEQGQAVMVAVDAEEIWSTGQDAWVDEWLHDFPGLPGQDANHAVQVIGIDRSDSAEPMVILNDPGTPNGQGLKVPADEFLNAWNDSGRFMVSTTGNPIAPQIMLGALDSWGRPYYPSSGEYYLPFEP